MVRGTRIARLTRHIDLPSLKAAARAAIVVPTNFAFADGVIQNPETTLFAVFGSFAILVLADFGGPWKRRLAAYLGLAAAGFVLITLGTLCSETPWLAVAAMAVVGFVILISGVISGYFAAGGFAALLLFILPIGVPGPASVIPDRLAGFAFACAVSICAAMLLWPTRPPDALRSRAAGACRALADLMDAELSGDSSAIPERHRPPAQPLPRCGGASWRRRIGRAGRRAPPRRWHSWSTHSSGCSPPPPRRRAGCSRNWIPAVRRIER